MQSRFVKNRVMYFASEVGFFAHSCKGNTVPFHFLSNCVCFNVNEIFRTCLNDL